MTQVSTQWMVNTKLTIKLSFQTLYYQPKMSSILTTKGVPRPLQQKCEGGTKIPSDDTD